MVHDLSYVTIYYYKFPPDSDSEIILKIGLFDEVKAYKNGAIFGPPGIINSFLTN